MTLNIGIDLFSLVPGVGRGAGFQRYASGLLAGLAELDDSHRYVLFVNRHNASMFPSGGRFVQKVIHLPSRRSAWPFRLWWQHVALPILARRMRLDLVHFPMDTASVTSLGCPYVVTIHDLIGDVYYPAHHPESISWLRARYLFLAKRHAGRSAATVICDSKATAQGVRLRYGVPGENTVVVPLAVQELFFHDDPADERHNGSGESPRILAVASLSPHKNLETVVRAFELARRTHNLPHELHIIGMPGMNPGPIERYLEAERQRGIPIRYLGFVDDETLRKAYRSAALLVYVPHVEGFGLPPLEAMASRTPVIASNVSSMPEVCGNAARLVPPDDVDAVARAIEDVLNHPDVARRLREAGNLRAREFSWSLTAERTREIYERAAGYSTLPLPLSHRHTPRPAAG